MTENHNRGLLIVCVGSAGLCGSAYLFVASQIWPDADTIDLFGQALSFAFVVLCTVAIAVSLPDVISHYVEHIQHWKRLSGVPESKPAQAAQETLQQTPRHRYSTECESYWRTALDYAGEVGGISFSRTKEFFGSDLGTWQECFAYPMVRAGYVNPVQSRVETTCADGWSIDKIKWALESGHHRLTPLPYPPPAPFSKQAASTTVDNSDKTTVFASTTRK